jgi:hypothetical protein
MPTPVRYKLKNGIYQQEYDAVSLGVTLPHILGDAGLFLGPFPSAGWQYASIYGKIKADAVTAPATIVTARIWLYDMAGNRIIARNGGTACSWGAGTDANDHETIFFTGNGQVGSDSIRDEAAVILGTSSGSPVWGFTQFAFEIIRSQPVAPNAATATISALNLFLRSR